MIREGYKPMTEQTISDSFLQDKCSEKLTECIGKQQESCPMIFLKANLWNLADNSLNLLTASDTLEALASIADSKDSYPEECFDLIQNLQGATICATADAFKQYGSVEFPSDLAKLNDSAQLKLELLWKAIKLVSEIFSSNDLEEDFVGKFGGIIWHDKMSQLPTKAYTCTGTNHGTQKSDNPPIQITYPKLNNELDFNFEFESVTPLGACGKVRIYSHSGSNNYQVLKLTLIEDDLKTSLLVYEAANNILVRPFASYIGVDIDGFPFIVLSADRTDTSWLDFSLETASLFSSACLLTVLDGIKYSHQKSAELMEKMANACNLTSLKDILSEFTSLFNKLAAENITKNPTPNQTVDGVEKQKSNGPELSKPKQNTTLPNDVPSLDTYEKAATGNIRAIHELALYARNFDVTCSLGLCIRAQKIYEALYNHDKNSVNLIQYDDLFLLFLLTSPDLPFKNLKAGLKMLLHNPYKPIADNAKKVLDKIAPKRSLFSRVKYGWKRPWGIWRPIFNPDISDLIDESYDLIPVMKLCDIRPWKGEYFIGVSSELDERTGLLSHCGIHISHKGKELILNEQEEEYFNQQIRNLYPKIRSLSNLILFLARTNTETWKPYNEGWEVLEQTKNLSSNIEALIKANPLPH